MRVKFHLPRSLSVFALSLCLLLAPATSLAQVTIPMQEQSQTPAKPPVNQSDDPLLKKFVWRGIGPASMGGRIDDIEAVESNPFTYYVAYATGGLWKTTNNGTTFEPIFDTYATASVGDVAICQSNPNIIWVGTGEPNNRQSSTFGDGIYKSTDGGKTFKNMGLKETQTIARVVIDPKDANIVYVAALGHLFGANKERGIYKTTDGGNTWNLVKSIDENTGFTDIVIDPADTKTLYAASYQRRRTPFGFNGGGEGSALWKTTDAGKSWTKLEGNGLPETPYGRIGLDIARSNPNVIYVQIEIGAFTGNEMGMNPADVMGMFGQQNPNQPPNPKRSGLWRTSDKGKTWTLVSNNNNRPMYYSQVRVDPSNENIVYTGGLNFSRSTDGGKTFKNLAGVAHSDHHAIWINPKNGQHVMIGNDGGLDVSYDQGETFDFINTMATAQFYAVGVDMRKPYYVCGGLQDNGSWCAPSATRNPAGITNSEWYRVGSGDGFYVLVDPTDHNTVYAESQNGAVQRVDLKTGQSKMIRPRAAMRPRQMPPPAGNPEQTPATPAQAGAEPQPAAQPSAQPSSQPASQPGAIQMPPRVTMQSAQRNQQGQGQQPDPSQMMGMMMGFGGGNPMQSNIVPAPPQGEQYRFNWNTPIHISPHNPRLIYVGANKLFRSFDRGDTWVASPDLTKQIDRNKLEILGVAGDKAMISKHDGTANYSNITTIAESPLVPGVLWVGTDDGNVQLSRDGGATWSNVAKNIPVLAANNHQISRVEPSRFDAATCYVTVDGHRSNDHQPYVFVTRDYGATWSSLANNLPTGNVNVIREDLKNKSLLFVGTEYGAFVSINGGAEWKKFMTGLPTVRVDDLLIHPRENDLIAATHGRGIYIIDDITPLQQLNDKVMVADAHLFDIRPGTQWLNEITLSRAGGGQKLYRGENPQAGTAISYHLKAAPKEDVKITISDINGKVLRNLTGTKDVGLNRVQWNLRGDPPQNIRANFGPMAAMMGGSEPQPGGQTAQTAQPPAQPGQPATQPAAQSQAQQPAQQPGQPGNPPGTINVGGRRFNIPGPAIEPGTYLVKLTIDGKEYTTKVVVEADTWK